MKIKTTLFKLSSYLSAGFRGHLEGGLEGPSLLSGQDGSRSFGPPGILRVIPLPLASYAFLRLDVQLLIVTFLCRKRHLFFSARGLNRLHPFSLWQSADKYIFILSYSGRFTHRESIIKGDTCVFDTLLSIYYKRKRPCVRLDLQKSTASRSWWAQWNMHICQRSGHRVTRNLLRSALSDLH